MSFQITLAFLQGVKENNSTERVHTYRDLYQQEKTRFAEFTQKLLDQLKPLNSDFAELETKDCIFRFNRDARFSHNKNPYKEHFGAVIAPGGRKSAEPCLYVHLEPGNKSIIAGGIYLPPTPVLHATRKHIAKHLKQRTKLISDPKFKDIYGDVQGKELVKIPRGYDAQDPAAQRFLYKGRYVHHPLTDAEVNAPDFLEKVVEYYKILKPFNDFLAF